MTDNPLEQEEKYTNLQLQVANHEFRLGMAEQMIVEQKAEFKELMGFLRKISFWIFTSVVLALAIVVWDIITRSHLNG